MLFVPTCSEDATLDLMMPFLGEIDLFRFNIDNWRGYRWDFSQSGFSVESPDGKILTSENAKCVYLRKPIFFDAIDVPKDGSLENWCRAEVERIFQDLYYKMCAEGRAALVHPPKFRFYKPAQMALAAKYFEVPPWHIVSGAIPESIKDGEWVAKTLTQEKIGANKVFFVKKVDAARLDPRYPWFLQKRVEADSDVTAVYANGKIFAFELDRKLFDGDDCRKSQPFDKNMVWKPLELSARDQSSIIEYMGVAGLDFGRFDFLRKGGKLIFLELNPNGQWAWLDLENKYGLIEFISGEIVKKYKSCE